MPRRSFQTVAEELLDAAEVSADYFAKHGYSIRVEKSELGFPYTPTMVCRRQSTTLIVEVDAGVRMNRLQEWVAFAKSTGKDTRVIVILPSEGLLDSKSEAGIRRLGIGLMVTSEDGCVERVAGRDLALGVELPELSQLPQQVRGLLGPAYEQFARSQWREGFEEACQALEGEARRYLKSGLRTGRIVIVGRRAPGMPEVDRMTMGQLADIFARIQNQNRADSLIGQTLKSINKDRIGVVHHKSKKRTESRLRANVGRHMWSVFSALRELRS